VNANARDMFDHARPDLDQALADRRDSALASGLVRGIAARTPVLGDETSCLVSTP
jgi:hypothetical protein